MKIFKVLLVVAIALGMMACNNEQDVPEISGEKDASISIKVVPSSDSPSFRAVGNLSDNGIIGQGLEAESAIHHLEVWVFSGDVLKAYGTSTTDEIKDLETSVGESTIVVAANAKIGIVGSKTALLAKLGDLPPRDITDDGLVMTAEPIEVTLVAGNNYYGYTEADVTAEVGEAKTTLSDTPLAITRVNARVAIVSAVLDYESVPETQRAVFTHLGDIEVAMFNVPNETKLFGDSLATNDDFQFGADWPSPKYSYVGVGTGTPNPDLHDSIAGLPISAESAPYYYVNENNSSVVTGTETDPDQKMLIVLRAKVYNGKTVVTELKDLFTDTEGYTYYPILVNKDGVAKNGKVGDGNVYRNTQYNISLTIKGLGNPSIDDVDKAFLDVKVQVAPWNVVTQNVEW
jgi:hypothetical protein